MDRIMDSGSIDWGSTPHGCTDINRREAADLAASFHFFITKPLQSPLQLQNSIIAEKAMPEHPANTLKHLSYP